MNRLVLFILWLQVADILAQSAPVSEPDRLHHGVITAVVTDIDRFESRISEWKTSVRARYRPANIVVLDTMTTELREKIVALPEILWYSLSSLTPKEELPVPGHNLFVNRIAAAHTEFPHFNGSGIVVSVKEFPFDSTDVDFLSRVQSSPGVPGKSSVHATVIASLVAGAGNSDVNGLGVAPGCRLVASDYGSLLPEEDYTTPGISVQNHSYGADIENFYGANALAYDVSTRENDNLLHVFSSGNEGITTSTIGPYAQITGFANLTGNFKMAKNVLCVGAVDSMGNRLAFSSNGPAYDGRVKPDLVAFGPNGSSEAAALVSGAVAVLQQTYHSLYNSLPESAWLRAVLINAAADKGRPGPDFEYGFGNLDLQQAIRSTLGQHFFSASLKQQELAVLPLVVPPNTARLQLTLTWNDPPAVAGAPKALVNDLDVSLIDPLGRIWLPWTLNVFPNADSLRQPASRHRDTLNNVEQITVYDPEPGLHEIRIEGARVTGTAQAFSVVYALEPKQHFEWTFPSKNAPFLPGHEVMLRWESNRSPAIGRLEWKPVASNDWTIIDTVVDLNAGIRRWLVPATYGAACLRMRSNQEVFQSDTFLIAPEVFPRLVFNCPDSLGLVWNKAEAGARYQVFGLGKKYMEPIFVSADTFAVLQKVNYPQIRFAVASMDAHNDITGKRNATADIDDQGFQCHEKNFYAVLNDDGTVSVVLELGGLYGVESVGFEKRKAGGFGLLTVVDAINTETVEYLDRDGFPGINVYRARINTGNGGAFTGDTAVVFVNAERGWLIFPNPVPRGGQIRILASFLDTLDFRLFDALGRQVFSDRFSDYPATMTLPDLSAGIYFYMMEENGKRLYSGSLMLR